MRVAKVSRIQLRLVGDTSRAGGCSHPQRCVWALAPLLVVARRLQAVRPEEIHRFIHLAAAHCITDLTCIHICVRGGMPARVLL